MARESRVKHRISKNTMIRCLPPNGNPAIRTVIRVSPNLPTQSIPAGYVARTEALTMCSEGSATWVDRLTIRLAAKDDIPKTDDESCRMGPNVIENNAADKPWAQALTHAWNPAISEVRLSCLRTVLARGIE